MKYLPYILIIVAAGLGAAQMPFRPALPLLAVLALASAFAVFVPRRRALREQPQAPDQNMLLDGVFLFVSQLLIVFVAYSLGLLLVRLF